MSNTSKSLENGIDILNDAIKNNISARKASRNHNFASSYLKNVKIFAKKQVENKGEFQGQAIHFLNLYQRYDHHRGEDSSYVESMDDTGYDQKEHTVDEEKTTINEVDYNNIEVDYVGNKVIRDVDELLTAAKINKDFWQIDKKVINKWDTSFKIDEEIVKSQNYQIKAWLSKKQDVVEVFHAAEEFRKLVENYNPKHPKVKYKTNRNEHNLLEITLFDLHLGKLCWAGETGENYDSKIASNRFMIAIQKLLDRAEPYDFERILFPIGNDFFNSDNLHNTTTAGTPQDEDLRWQKTYTLGINLLVQAIDLLSLHAPVDVVVVPGNHDFERCYYMGETIKAWYRNTENVNVDNGANPRKYYNYGETLIGLTHGKEEKLDRLPMIMATEQRKMWGNTKYHEFHLGHIHRKRIYKYNALSEDLGVTIRFLSSLSGTEEWHNKKGFVGNVKAAEAFLWNKENGYLANFNVNLEDSWDIAL